MYKLSLAIGGFIVATVFLVFAAMFLVSGEQRASATSYGATILSTATTSTAVSVTASTRVLATTTNSAGLGASYTRTYATICNPSSTVVYLNMNADKLATVTSSVAQIAAAAGYNSCYEITDRNLYQGSVQASSTVAAVNVLVTEYVQ